MGSEETGSEIDDRTTRFALGIALSRDLPVRRRSWPYSLGIVTSSRYPCPHVVEIRGI